jgi:hypothetical protein
MTGAVADRIERGGFLGPDWVGRYLVEFANHYRRAVHDFERGPTGRYRGPGCWRSTRRPAGTRWSSRTSRSA